MRYMLDTDICITTTNERSRIGRLSGAVSDATQRQERR